MYNYYSISKNNTVLNFVKKAKRLNNKFTDNKIENILKSLKKICNAQNVFFVEFNKKMSILKKSNKLYNVVLNIIMNGSLI